jgi:predicted PurR-regulated permease PerM
MVLGLWGGLTEVIPILGPWLGLIPAALVALTVSPLTAVLVIAAYILIQQAEAQFLVPKVMGKAVGLSPVIIIITLLIGAKLFGVVGAVVAVPVAAVISVIVQEWPEIQKLRR